MTAIAARCAEQCLGSVDEVAELYAAHAVRVRRLVRLSVQAPDPVIEDACQVAWMRLVRCRERVHRATAPRWVVRVAVREAFSLARRATRDVSLDALVDEDATHPQALATPELIEDLAERRDRLEALRGLPERQQRLVWLQALGYSYAEMSAATGESNRTVDRQLSRARRALSERQAA